MIIKILGVGCPKCKAMEKNLDIALKELNIDATVEVVGDLKEIVSYGVMVTPALVVDEKVIKSGRALSVKEIKKIINGE